MVQLLFALIAVSSLPMALLVPAGASNTSLDVVSVSGAQPAQPRLQLRTPFSVKATARRVLEAGSGEIARAGERATFRYLMVDGRNGTVIPSSYGWNPANVFLDHTSTDRLITDTIIGSAVGTRTLVAAPSTEAYVKRLVGTNGVKRGDTVLFVFDLVDVHTPLSSAAGTAIASIPPGLPVVDGTHPGAPTITVPQTSPPGGLISLALVQGTGPKVEVGQNVLVNYEGMVWRTGRVFDSTWRTGTPLQVAIGVGEVMTGWDNGLIGQAVGSRVLLVVPRDQGFGARGNARLGVSGTDTLVFVIDILDAWT